MCKINEKHFPSVIPDNDISYIECLGAIIDSVDELASMEISRGINSYNFRIAPSLPKYNKLLLEEILKFNNLFKIRLDISKSIKSSCTINFNISLA